MNFKRSTTSIAIMLMALSLVSMASIQQDAFAQSQGMSITATADKGSDTVTVTGMTSSGYTDVTFRVTSPSGNNVVAIDQVTPDENGNFDAKFKVGLWKEDGYYTIQAKQGQGIFTLTVDVQVNNGMTEKTSDTESTLDTGIFVPNVVTRDAGLELDAASFVNGDDRFTVTGITDRFSQAVVIQIFAPNGNLVTTAQESASLDGVFTAEIIVGGPLWKQNGDYSVTAYQNDNPNYSDSIVVDILDGKVIPEFGTIAAMILAVSIISIIAISAKSRLSIMPRY
ncbi:MAG: PEFG-CTERM sorting domain-containing protein [Nitrosopumilus sp.]|nr:PEFG-CTERM sorting domain-containing protein [Nitrosopumilus sp.]NRA05160.1 PEFG-CTERM sorting domain-containing protein [Nitrosopumilus sp.]